MSLTTDIHDGSNSSIGQGISDTNALAVFRYPRHPIAEVIPEMDATTLAALVTDIAKDGLAVHIVLHEGKILDGWARYQACLKAQVEPIFREFEADNEGNPLNFVLRQAVLRKHFEKPQLAMIAGRLVTSKVGHNQTNQGTTIPVAAAMAGVNSRLVERALVVKRASPMVADAVADGRIISMRAANTLARLPSHIQQSVLSSESGGAALKKKIHSASMEWKSSQPIITPDGRFSVIVADPPWPMDKAPYQTMTLPEVQNELGRLLSDKAADDCWLFLWTTHAHLPFALETIRLLGWTYKWTMVWHKANGPQNPNGPMYTEEFAISATKGSPIFVDTKNFKTSIEGKKRKHSEKPDEFFATIKRVTSGPRLELFTRKRHVGFEAHGNEIEEISGEALLVPGSDMPRSQQPLHNTALQLIASMQPMDASDSEQEQCS